MNEESLVGTLDSLECHCTHQGLKDAILGYRHQIPIYYNTGHICSKIMILFDLAMNDAHKCPSVFLFFTPD